jgi:lipopolysaccharide transport system ATP-binding protein
MRDYRCVPLVPAHQPQFHQSDPTSNMADDVVICAERLGKKYLIGHAAERERYVALRDVLARGARSAWRKTLDLAHGRAILAGDTVEEFWALKDVSFEVKRGEVLGIIGRNGAGKSTLLKILSRITEPSEGRVTIRGRVASLLEVGTGFHPELTGRENIYLNGAVLGMTRAEIRKKFDEIVDFAEVDKFLDTPVKRYSSGMYVRLAFAVAAHLEPEILVVDEVLAVGDAEFQKKCLGKMSEVAGGGRTVLFVSHNMAAVRSLCRSALLFERGWLIAHGTDGQIIEQYLTGLPDASAGNWKLSNHEIACNDALKVRQVRVNTLNRACVTQVMTDEPFSIAIDYEQRTDVRGIRISLQLMTRLGEVAFTTTDHCERAAWADRPGVRTSTCQIPGKLLNQGKYTIRVCADIPGVEVLLEWCEFVTLTVVGHHNGGTNFPDAEWPGVISPALDWTITDAEQDAPATLQSL